ncbi:MAG TPA: hypothetical protein VI168_13575, partial [Croceibacterium sp.]
MSSEWVRGRATPLSPEEVERLRQEAVSEFAGRLAHTLGNLLQVVNGNLELLAQRTADETALRYLENAREPGDVAG